MGPALARCSDIGACVRLARVFCHTLAISESAVPNNGKVGNRVLCPHSRCFGSHFDGIFLALPTKRKRSFSNVELSVRPTQGTMVITGFTIVKYV